MSALPTGLVTFLFTDIEGSTRLWERFQNEMGVAVARHDALLRQVIESHGGRVFKTIGDAFCAVFQSAPDALEAAVRSQLALRAEFGPWPQNSPSDAETGSMAPDNDVLRLSVRMAIHTGSAEERENDYFGAAVNRVARLLSTAHGGQIVLSASATEAVSAAVPHGVALRDLGRHILKDLYDPERVHQALHADLPASFPLLRSMQAFKHNLPCQLTSFIGREREMEDVVRLLSTTRLLTLTGSGGTGKTRLSLQVAADLVDEYPDGVWFVELGALIDPGIVAQTVAVCMRVHEEPGSPIVDTLASALRAMKLLLILDNCEHVLDSCSRLVEILLRTCPEVQVLATSREPLQIEGETTYRVPSLDLPGPRRTRKAGDLTEYGSVRLFRDRVRAVLPNFEITPENADSVSQVCRRLDGIPLALELAAARVNAMPVQQIAQRLDNRFSLLTRGIRTALPRQQTLRALIDWSWELLSVDEQVLGRRLSVFSGGFTLEACEEVCSDDAVSAIRNPQSKIEKWQVLDLIAQLVDKSLVISEEQAGAARYRLLETVRQYARERLQESGEELEVKGRHFRWYLALALEAEPHLEGQGMQEWLDRLEVEHDNLRAALAFPEDADSRLRLASAMNRFWFIRGYLTEGREWLESALAESGTLDTTLRGKALNRTGILAWRQGDFAAARNLFTSSLALHAGSGDKLGAAAALNNLGLVADDEGDLVAARAYHEDALRMYRDLGNRRHIGMVLANLGALLINLGDLDAAAEASREFLAYSQEAEDPWCTATAWHNLGEIELRKGNVDTAVLHLHDAMRLVVELGDQAQTVQTMFTVGQIAITKGQPKRAIMLLGAAEALREASHVHIPKRDMETHEETKAAARALVGEEIFEECWQQGFSMPSEQAVELALEHNNL